MYGKEDVLGVMVFKLIYVMLVDECNKVVRFFDYFIDIGFLVEKVKEFVNIGDVVMWERELVEMGDCVNCKLFDNCLVVFIVFELFKNICGKELLYDVYIVFIV